MEGLDFELGDFAEPILLIPTLDSLLDFSQGSRQGWQHIWTR